MSAFDAVDGAASAASRVLWGGCVKARVVRRLARA